jgi:hypothetical protein
MGRRARAYPPTLAEIARATGDAVADLGATQPGARAAG